MTVGPDDRRTMLGANLGLFVVGLYSSAFGPALPFLAKAAGASLEDAGLVLSALFTGSIAASALVGARLHRLDPGRLAVPALVALAPALILLGMADRLALSITAGILLGLADGLVVATVHQIAAKEALDPDAAINRLNLWFAVGATIGPLWSGAVLASGGSLPVVYVGVAAVAVAAAVVLAGRRRPTVFRPHGLESHSQSMVGARRVPLLMAAVLFFYVGAEIGLGAWVSSYAALVADAGVMTGAIVASAYWGALALGRLYSTRRAHTGGIDSRFLIRTLVLAVISSAVLVGAGEVLLVGGLAAFVTGFAFGPVWPTALSVGVRNAPAAMSAALVTAGNSGGIVLPWIQGKVLADGGARQGMALTVAMCLLMVGLALFARLPRRSESPDRSR